jgi:myo-inositol catabolism protein IolC
MTPAQVEATKKSASDALQVAAKYILLKSFTISKTIIGKNALTYLKGAVRVP